MLGAIIVVGAEDPSDGNAVGPARFAGEVFHRGSLTAGVEILGHSLLEATVEALQNGGIEPMSLPTEGSRLTLSSTDDCEFRDSPAAGSPRRTVESFRVQDAGDIVGSKLNDQHKSGIDTTLVMRLGAYVELDLTQAMQFHRDQRQPATRLADSDGPLDIWIVETAHFAAQMDVLNSLQTADLNSCAVQGYVNRLAHPRNLRQLAVDALLSRCRLRPRGSEVQPGIWLGEGAQVHRGARVASPAFIGRGSTVGEDCTIANCTAVESDCEIDYGSALSDVSLLPNSYVGIGLDIRHSVVNGGTLLSLEHDLTLEVSDPGVVRFNKAPHQEVSRHCPADVEVPGMLFTPAEEAAN